MSTIHANPSVETVKGWSVEQVKNFLNSKMDEFSLNYNEIAKVEENSINGRAFLSSDLQAEEKEMGSKWCHPTKSNSRCIL
ncbi:6472_t:CDS:2, partial [Funneliformis geosporum]